MSGIPPAVASWRDQIDRLSPHASPCRYLAPTNWAALRENALALIDRFGIEACRLGWTAPQLFGVHPVHGTVLVDFCGALMIAAAPALGIEATRVLFERTSAYRNLPGQQ
ncbi:hypothetical protein ACRAWG_21020 [Methylobacterium sp. P31]